MNKRTWIIMLGIIVIGVVLALLENSAEETSQTDPTPNISTQPVSTPLDEAFSQYPVEARIATHSGDPRTTGYWALWNSCALENRADVAAANGGREAGWFLMDDLLEDPGIQLGDLPVSTCKQGLALLESHSTDRDSVTDSVYRLAAQLLAAELNLNLGAESCPTAEEVVIGAHIILEDLEFNGNGTYVDSVSGDIFNSITALLELLTGYNSGELCIN